MRRFHLERVEDVSGVSGVGVVAEGCAFSTGKAVLVWVTQYRSVAVYDSIEELENIHGHNGRTRVVWLDDASHPSTRISRAEALCISREILERAEQERAEQALREAHQLSDD